MPVAGQGLGVLKLKEGHVSGPCPARGRCVEGLCQPLSRPSDLGGLVSTVRVDWGLPADLAQGRKSCRVLGWRDRARDEHSCGQGPRQEAPQLSGTAVALLTVRQGLLLQETRGARKAASRF